MPDLVVLSTDDALNAEIRGILAKEPLFDATFLKTRTLGIQYLNYELPEINVIYWSDKALKASEIVDEIRKDPWLHYGACLFIYDNAKDAEEIRKLDNVNLLASMERARVSYYLSRVLAVLREHPNLLSLWNFGALVRSHVQGSFQLNRDAFDILTHVNLLCNFLSNAHLIGREEKEEIFSVLVECLMKVVEFERGTGKGAIQLDYNMSSSHTRFTITPEDTHFSWDKVGTEGIIKSAILTQSLKGRHFTLELCLEKAHGGGHMPTIFDAQRQETYQPGDVVFNQGEESHQLFFIVSGEYDVFINDKRISTLGPLDVFLGEMSFLLKNKRTATVKAVKEGCLVKISKQEYIHSLKEKPHYAFFLARMLAERLAKLHQIKT